MYLFALTLVLGLFSATLCALQLTPSSHELAPSGGLSARVFEVVNDSGELIAVQVSALSRQWSADQRELNQPAGDFELFPRQLILRPGEKKGVRVRWTGPPDLAEEKAFRLLVQQLPVNFGEGEQNSAVKVLHQVVGALYVAPDGARPALSLGRPSKQTLPLDKQSGKHGDFLVFDVTNTGSKHILLNKAGLVARGREDLPLTPARLAPLDTQNVLPGATLRVQLPWPAELDGPVTEIVQR